MDEVLEKLFESTPKTRLLRLFMRNVGSNFTLSDIVKRVRLKPAQVRKELTKLFKLGIIKQRIVIIREKTKVKIRSRGRKKVRNTSKTAVKSKKVTAYYANTNFWLFNELRDLITKSSVTSRKMLRKKLGRLGGVKLAVVSGVFINRGDRSRTDLLLVGDNIKKSKLDHFMRQLESELGKYVHYTTMDTAEFKYRIDMYDRFLRDILEFPHEKLINRLNV